jgi:putative intracellular protease/amidase
MKDPEILSFVRRIAEDAEYVATVCTGAFIAARPDCSTEGARQRIIRPSRN